MEIVTNKTFSGETVVMDDKNFIGCRFDKCQIVYAGGDFSWVNSHFNECSPMFTGPAARTVAFLQNTGALPKPDGNGQNSGAPVPPVKVGFVN